jgi:glycosyltransferase involved in cell wall biosynthesis
VETGAQSGSTLTVSSVKISFVIPAFNEAKRLGGCLDALQQSLRTMNPGLIETEIIVVDNNSTDSTPEIARTRGVQVVFEPVNQISRARNAGGQAATGEWLVFLDADTLVNPGTLEELRGLIASGRYAGGGTVLRYDRTPLFWKGFLWVANCIFLPLLRWTPGCFIFCRAEAFHAVGGYDTSFYAGEDVEFGKAVRRWGRGRGLGLGFVRRNPPVTSIRKIDLYGSREVFRLIVRWLLFPKQVGRDKSQLGIFYDGRR